MEIKWNDDDKFKEVFGQEMKFDRENNFYDNKQSKKEKQFESDNKILNSIVDYNKNYDNFDEKFEQFSIYINFFTFRS